MTSKKIAGGRIGTGAPVQRITQPNLKQLLRTSAQEDLILTPALTEWLMKNGDLVLSESVHKRVSSLIGKPQRDRTKSFSASGAGRCNRREQFAFLGMPQSGSTGPQLQSIFFNGSWVHLRWQAVLLQGGLLDDVEVPYTLPSLRLKGSLDGEGTGTTGRFRGREFGWELKGRNDHAYNVQMASGVDDTTRAQVDRYFLSSDHELFVIINENKNTQVWKEWVLVRDEKRVQDAKNELERMNEELDNHRLSPMLDECRSKKGEWLRCPYSGEVCLQGKHGVSWT